MENETILNNTSQCCNGYGNKNDNIDNNVIHANKTRVGSNSNSPVPSTYKLSQSNGVQPFMPKHLITPNPIFGKLLHMNTGFQEDAAVSIYRIYVKYSLSFVKEKFTLASHLGYIRDLW